MKVLILLFLSLGPIAAGASPSSPMRTGGELIAFVVTQTLNQNSTIEKSLDLLSQLQNSEEVQGVKAFLKRNNISLNTPLTQPKADRNKINFGPYALLINDNETFQIAGHVFHPKKESLKVILQKILKLRKMSSSNTPYLFSAAFADEGPLSIFDPVINAVVATYTFITEAFLFAYGAAVLGLAILDIIEQFRDGDVTCDGNDFIVRKHTEGLLSRKKLKFPLEVVSHIFKTPMASCTPENAKILANHLKGHDYPVIKSFLKRQKKEIHK